MEEDKSTIKEWQKIKNFPNEDYRKYFEDEKEYLKKNIEKEDIVLDLGCGGGDIILFLSEIAKRVYGIDNSEEAINECKEKILGVENIEIFLEGAERMHFENNYVDKIVCFGNTFGNFGESRKNILREVKRILKDGGEFIFSVYNENALDSRLKIYGELLPNKFEIIDKNKGKVLFKKCIFSEQFSREEIKNILNESGFEIEDIKKGEIFYLIKCKKK